MTDPVPFQIEVPQQLLDWIDQRIKTTRLPPGKETLAESNSETEKWSYGLPLDTAQKLHQFWCDKYNWRKVESGLNQELQMFTMKIRDADEGMKEEELNIHFVHHRAKNPEYAIPLLFLHGWPGSFLEVRKIIKQLTEPEDPDAQQYHVVAPSLPGYGFSSYPKAPCSPMRHGRIVDKLMRSLGYDRYILQGGDWGAIIGRCVAIDYPDSCQGLHLNMLFSPPPDVENPMEGLTEREKAGLARMKWWMEDENGYLAIQGTKPQTISYALTDSPFGMMCWIRDKLQHLVDDDYVWDEEEVITWCMPYIINGTPGHAEIYKWASRGSGPEPVEANAKLFGVLIPKEVAVGCSSFPKDAAHCPRSWAEAKVSHNIVFWHDQDKGGHFAAVEKPAELVKDIRNFTQAMSSEKLAVLRK